MGLFSKIKDNLHHGGVKVQVQAPASIPANQAIPIAVTLTADSPQTITNVKVEVRAEAKEQGVTFGGPNRGGMGVEESQTTEQTIAQAESRQAFTIASGETKTVNLELYLNGAAGNNLLGSAGNASGALGGALQAIATAAQSFDHVNYLYSVHASADVEGITLDPSDKVPIQILPPTAMQTTASPTMQSFDSGSAGQPSAPNGPGQDGSPLPPMPAA
jgi:hypothetical protein